MDYIFNRRAIFLPIDLKKLVKESMPSIPKALNHEVISFEEKCFFSENECKS